METHLFNVLFFKSVYYLYFFLPCCLSLNRAQKLFHRNKIFLYVYKNSLLLHDRYLTLHPGVIPQRISTVWKRVKVKTCARSAIFNWLCHIVLSIGHSSLLQWLPKCIKLVSFLNIVLGNNRIIKNNNLIWIRVKKKWISWMRPFWSWNVRIRKIVPVWWYLNHALSDMCTKWRIPLSGGNNENGAFSPLHLQHLKEKDLTGLFSYYCVPLMKFN